MGAPLSLAGEDFCAELSFPVQWQIGLGAAALRR